MYGKRIKWFDEMIPNWILPGGIMHGFSKPHRKTLSQKFRAAEKKAKDHMERRSHQTDTSGERDESLPLWMNAFQDYLKFAAENPYQRVVQQREAQKRRTVGRAPLEIHVSLQVGFMKNISKHKKRKWKLETAQNASITNMRLVFANFPSRSSLKQHKSICLNTFLLHLVCW